jgi:hypothetical protein
MIERQLIYYAMNTVENSASCSKSSQRRRARNRSFGGVYPERIEGLRTGSLSPAPCSVRYASWYVEVEAMERNEDVSLF